MKLYLKLALLAAAAFAVSYAGEDKVTICHFPPGNPANVQVITIGVSALPSHVALHGDFLFSSDPQSRQCSDGPIPQ